MECVGSCVLELSPGQELLVEVVEATALTKAKGVGGVGLEGSFGAACSEGHRGDWCSLSRYQQLMVRMVGPTKSECKAVMGRQRNSSFSGRW